MEKVNGIGGIFFRTGNPEKLAKWYEKHLGVNPVPAEYSQLPWVQEGGPTVFAPFKNDTTYFGKESQSWMINFRVNDLSKMADQLRRAGIEVAIDAEEYPNGKFARIHDPEGNPVELWEPKS
ncbi:VOC family protein [uncultured Microbulbifer sp.]|uniref:VOC family protein n=1 Tax=uncultured Microbulbifer sp. TaxID=348147 RepID=UPI00263631EB|nr:VOC family protein [uncultured Microbulbifer sp.]